MNERQPEAAAPSWSAGRRGRQRPRQTLISEPRQARYRKPNIVWSHRWQTNRRMIHIVGQARDQRIAVRHGRESRPAASRRPMITSRSSAMCISRAGTAAFAGG